MPPDTPAASAAIVTANTVKPVLPVDAKQAATQADGSVKVKPVKTYHCSSTNEMRTSGGEAYPVARYQAAELVSKGLAEYENPADEDAAIEARVKAEGEAIRAARKAR